MHYHILAARCIFKGFFDDGFYFVVPIFHFLHQNLSVEIARKILMQKVENGDYEIESIIKEALKNAPGSQDVIVHLNPEDLEKCQKAQQDGPGGVLAGIKLIPDPNIG